MRPVFSGSKRIAAGVMGLLMLVIVLFSAFYVAAEADHDCCGEDCPVCESIQLCEATLRRAVSGTTAPRAAVVPVVLFLFAVIPATLQVSGETLVSRKVRLNN